MAGDSIRLRAGNKAGMPQLSHREPAYVWDEQALYVGTPEGNVQVAAAGTAGRVTALETLTAAQGESLAAHSGLLSVHRESLAAHGGTLTAHAERLTDHGETLDTHAELLESVEGVQQTHAETISAYGETLNSHSEMLAALEEIVENHTAALTACGESVQQLRTEKLSAKPAAALAALAADADGAAVIAAYNALLAALQAAGIMHQEG